MSYNPQRRGAGLRATSIEEIPLRPNCRVARRLERKRNEKPQPYREGPQKPAPRA